ncbi:hypothetical protein AURDEDRAFT_166331 [Auricularia subglabra TFB-10046 SS5]|uniref:C2H2-type domain-containing protein n=1 Tax=Auricularia subglabra (strain TFB-10046 / SS5) TaxID=717982 RepID=J0WXM4_AURST|nr:hypothetical protein AURDEDRAFT_166331 [Auricularia subglabra TFB-10046 SS5]
MDPSLACRWVRCESTFSNDDAGAAELWAHLTDKHLLAVSTTQTFQCQWDTCTRSFDKSFGSHLRSHLPKWYRPYECAFVQLEMPPAPLPCRWEDCSTPGPYPDDKALYKHLEAAHNPQRGLLHCKWNGCGRTTVLSGGQDIAAHLCSHTDFRPFVCAHPDCGHAVIRAYELRRHIVEVHSGHAQPRPGDGGSSTILLCRWVDCAREFPNDSTGAGQLWEHINNRHALQIGPGDTCRCRWGSCGRAFRHGFVAHLRSHLPKWYRPYECATCGRGFITGAVLAVHEKQNHSIKPAEEEEDSSESDDEDDDRKRRRKRRKLADDEPSPHFVRLEERVSVLEARFDALITGWKKGRGEKAHASSSSESESESVESEERDGRPNEPWDLS